MDQFERVKLIYTKQQFENIQSKTACICGVGGVGASCVESLVRTGVQKLILIDFDIVELSNLNRQIQANYETLGQPKALALKEKLLKINPDAQIEVYLTQITQDNIEFLENLKFDYFIDAIDQLDAKAVIIKTIKNKNIPLISSGGMGNRLDPTQIKVSRLDKTFNDPLLKQLRYLLRGSGCEKIKVVFSSELPRKREKPVASLSFVVNVAGHVLASEVIKDLGGAHETPSL